MPEDDEKVSVCCRGRETSRSRGLLYKFRRTRIGLLWICGCCSWLPDTGASENFERHLEAARYLEEGQWEEARKLYGLLALAPPESLQLHAYLGLARATGGLGKSREAVNLLRGLPVDGIGRPGERERWSATIAVELARLLGRRDEVEGALLELGKILEVPWKSQQIGIRTWVRFEMARVLVGSGRRKEAIKLLTESLPELELPERSGLRACQKARLAEIYMADGERDWAVTLLEEIRHDPQLDRDQFISAEAIVEGRDRGREVPVRLRLRREADCVVVQSEGLFELRMSGKQEGEWMRCDAPGPVTHWFNLEDDPFRTMNLAGQGALLRVSDPSHAKESLRERPMMVKFLEESSARIRFRCLDAKRPSNNFEEYTIYPTGQVFVQAVREESPVAGDESGLLLAISCNEDLSWWQRGGSPVANSEGSLLLLSGLPIPSNRPSLPDDLLLLPSRRGGGQIARSAGGCWLVTCPAAEETKRLAVQLRVYPRNLDSPSLVEPFLRDYQQPARIEVREGHAVTDEAGDLDADGYNEGEGCYVVRRGRTVVLHAGPNDRIQPAIKFLATGVNGIPDVLVNGKVAGEGSCRVSRLGADSLLVHWLETVPAGERIVFSLR